MCSSQINYPKCCYTRNFPDNAALAAHSKEIKQRLIDRLATACNEFGLSISLQKMEVLLQEVNFAPSSSIGEHTLNIGEKSFILDQQSGTNYPSTKIWTQESERRQLLWLVWQSECKKTTCLQQTSKCKYTRQLFWASSSAAVGHEV